jgi:hypothetical protein
MAVFARIADWRRAGRGTPDEHPASRDFLGEKSFFRYRLVGTSATAAV